MCTSHRNVHIPGLMRTLTQQMCTASGTNLGMCASLVYNVHIARFERDRCAHLETQEPGLFNVHIYLDVPDRSAHWLHHTFWCAHTFITVHFDQREGFRCAHSDECVYYQY